MIQSQNKDGRASRPAVAREDRSAENAAGFSVRGACFAADGATILPNLTLDLEPGLMHGVIGPNGSGKSTLLKLLARQYQPNDGRLSFAGTPLETWSARGFARAVAYMPQDLPASVGLTVRELVGFGRYPWHGALGRFGAKDHALVADAIADCGLESFSERIVDSLSGGERQRAWIAMALAQDATCLLLDEPTSALDIAHQMEVLALIRRLVADRRYTAILVLHDVNMAARFCDRVHAMKAGRLEASGTPAEIMTPDVLQRIFDIEMTVVEADGAKLPVAFPA